MKQLAYRLAALTDLDAIYDVIKPDSAERAYRFVTDIRRRCHLLCEYPLLGIARADFGTRIRIYCLDGRVVIVYFADSEAIQILRIFYGGQDYEAILRQGRSRKPPRS